MLLLQRLLTPRSELIVLAGREREREGGDRGGERVESMVCVLGRRREQETFWCVEGYCCGRACKKRRGRRGLQDSSGSVEQEGRREALAAVMWAWSSAAM